MEHSIKENIDNDSKEKHSEIRQDSTVCVSSNPSITDDLHEDIEKIKGDAIGDTLYSSRFVLKTLIKLTILLQPEVKIDEDFENDLCTLWDMTIEKDVVRLLLDQNVLELFAALVHTTEDQRLTEILIGIIGNMCSLSQTRDILCVSPEILSPILELVACSDSLILVQLMRLLHAALVFENSGDEITWFQHFKHSEDFVNKFSFMLANSMSNTLLANAFEALNAMCTKFVVIEIQPDVNDSSFRDIFVTPTLVSGIIEAFKQMLPDQGDNEQMDETTTPTQHSQKIMNLFLDIHVILSQYENSKRCYEPYLTDLLKCISQILEPLCQPICLFPLTTNEQGFIENINELFQSLGDPFHEKCFSQMIRIWGLIDTNSKNHKNPIDSDWENDSSNEEEVNADDINMTILEYLTRTSKYASIENIENSTKCLNVRNISNIYKALSAGDSEPDISECCTKFKQVAQHIWNIDISEPTTDS